MPEYTIRYILSGNGLDADKDVNIVWCSDTTEALSKLKSEDGAIAVLPQPFVTAASAQISGLRVVMDLNEAWEKINNNSKIVTGVIVVRKEFAENIQNSLRSSLMNITKVLHILQAILMRQHSLLLSMELLHQKQ